MNDVHIEFSHIYGDEAFGSEQIKSITIANELLKQIHLERQTVITSTLVDDYHAEYQLWNNHDDLIKQMEVYGQRPNIIASESSFVKIADEIIEAIPANYKREESFRKQKKRVLFFDDGRHKFALKDLFAEHEQYKCVVLSCAWLLCKLGKASYPLGSYVATSDVSTLHSHRVVSILDKRYQKVEQHVVRLLSLMEGENETDRVQYVFY